MGEQNNRRQSKGKMMKNEEPRERDYKQSYSSTLKMEAECFPKTFVTVCHIAWSHIPEDNHFL
jgi:hypothetical protein